MTAAVTRRSSAFGWHRSCRISAPSPENSAFLFSTEIRTKALLSDSCRKYTCPSIAFLSARCNPGRGDESVASAPLVIVVSLAARVLRPRPCARRRHGALASACRLRGAAARRGVGGDGGAEQAGEDAADGVSAICTRTCTRTTHARVRSALRARARPRSRERARAQTSHACVLSAQRARVCIPRRTRA